MYSNVSILNKKENVLFIFLSGFFITNALIAEFMGVKIFSLEKTLGFLPLNVDIAGINNLSFNLSAGVLLWPVVFIFTDVINEYFGIKGVRLLTFITSFFILFSFVMFYISIQLAPADFWITSHIPTNVGSIEKEALLKKVGDYNIAYRLVFGQGLWIIVGSISAFLTSQFVDVFIFQKIKQKTGEKMIWLRATGSTIISQFIDSFVVLFIAFYIGAGWSLKNVMVIGFLGYIYKFLISICITPMLYLVHFGIDKYLGKELAKELKNNALIHTRA